ncbi:MAG: nicotinate-nicotinamide nucleotide adenylyltransferase [Clostridia bacterium]|nr:nicotinate-nicotinamide nucleotide adenylyltransferase [Clostridia bacterium]MBQ8300240.1 nicotinate-nicotinamide nucleotide adenylyltransferase [Clostridia bacterium]
MRLGVYVGSFNPVHKGHKAIVDFLLEKKYVDKILMIPTENYWGKQNLIDTKYRLDMLKFYENEKIIVTAKYGDFKYTNEILTSLKNDFDDELYLIIGADNLVKFHEWKSVDKILENKVVVLGRDDIDMESLIQKFEGKENFVLIKDFPLISTSSTLVRKKIATKDCEDIESLIDTRIYKYICENNLYSLLEKGE